MMVTMPHHPLQLFVDFFGVAVSFVQIMTFMIVVVILMVFVVMLMVFFTHGKSSSFII